MGIPDFAVPALERLYAGGHDIVAVYTKPDRPSGRGLATTGSPVKRAAEGMGLSVRQVDNFKDADDVAALAELEPDVIVVASFGVILPQSVLDIPSHSCINLHPSLLPRYRGPTPVPAAILAGDDVTGTTIMLIERKVDSGPILAQREFPIDPSDTTGSLTAKLANLSADLLLETLPGWFARTVTPRLQRDEDATYTRIISKRDGEIDWTLPAVDLWRRVRAYHPWPSAFTSWNGRSIRIVEAAPQGGQIDRPGRVLELGGGGVGVQAGEGILRLARVQIEGRKEMAMGEFVRGQRGFIGSLLPG